MEATAPTTATTATDEAPADAALERASRDTVARSLRRRGYDVLELGWPCPAGVADIVAFDDDALVFVDVEAGRGAEGGFPPCAVTDEARERSERIALAFIDEHDLPDAPVRFDVASVVALSGGRALLRHRVNAFCAA